MKPDNIPNNAQINAYQTAHGEVNISLYPSNLNQDGEKRFYGRIIERIEDLSNPHSDGHTVTCGQAVKISGTALKLGGNEYGVFFAPVDEHDTLVEDRSTWTKVENVFNNKPSNLQFYVPEQLVLGKSYRIVIISSLSISGNRIKSPVQTVSDIVQAVK